MNYLPYNTFTGLSDPLRPNSTAHLQHSTSLDGLVVGPLSLNLQPTTGLIALRFTFLPDPIQDEYVLTGNTYYMVQPDSGLINKKEVAKTIVFKGFFSWDKTLDKTASQQLIEVLQDSSNYRSGEEGTPDFGRRLVFYNKAGDILGDTRLSDSGQSYTSPAFQRVSKWEMLNREGLHKVLALID